MSKYSKHLADKAYRKQTRETNKKWSELKKKIKEEAPVDERSTRETFLKWVLHICCCDSRLTYGSGRFVVVGQDGGISVTEEKVGDAPFNRPKYVDAIIDETFDKSYIPVTYSDWFYNIYLNN